MIKDVGATTYGELKYMTKDKENRRKHLLWLHLIKTNHKIEKKNNLQSLGHGGIASGTVVPVVDCTRCRESLWIYEFIGRCKTVLRFDTW